MAVELKKELEKLGITLAEYYKVVMELGTPGIVLAPGTVAAILGKK